MLEILTNLIDNLHKLIIYIANALGLILSDTGLQYLLIGGIGVFVFFITDALFKRIAKWNVSYISFVYTFTVLIFLGIIK